MNIQRYGWVPDHPDIRDKLFATHLATDLNVHDVDLRTTAFEPPIYDQGQLGSCTGNGIAAEVQFVRRKQGLKPDFIPSRLFIYYNERAMEGTINVDAGAMIRDGMKSVTSQGVCPESDWPYDTTQFTTRPSDVAYKVALHDRTLAYYRVTPTEHYLKNCLALGYSFVFGVSVYSSFEVVGPDGQVPMPDPSRENIVGGHCMRCVGNHDASRRFIVRNSWGTGWGDGGYCYMPYEYLLNPNLCDDRWTIRLET